MKLCFVTSHGGHLAEAMIIASALGERHDAFFITDGALAVGGPSRVYFVAGFLERPWRVLRAAAQIRRVLAAERPDAVISTGAEIAIPAFLVAKLLFRLPTVYVECSAQVRTPSLTGRIVYPLADLFLVQWEPLLRRYGAKAVYAGGLL